MPFTFAHPAAVIPLRRCLGRFGVLSALVIGSLTPDLAYFLPWRIARAETHSLLGLCWFGLPIGLLTYIVFHVLLKGPLLGLLPRAVICRLGGHTSQFRSLPSASWIAVLVSLLCGAMTHLVWDAFTHTHVPGITAFSRLKVKLFAVGTYHVYGYEVLQYGSTVVGLALLLIWFWRWLMKASPCTASLPVTLSPAGQLAVIVTLAGMSTVAGVWAGMQGVGGRTGVTALRIFVGKAIFLGLPVLGLTVVVYSIGWHVWRIRAESAG